MSFGTTVGVLNEAVRVRTPVIRRMSAGKRIVVVWKGEKNVGCRGMVYLSRLVSLLADSDSAWDDFVMICVERGQLLRFFVSFQWYLTRLRYVGRHQV